MLRTCKSLICLLNDYRGLCYFCFCHMHMRVGNVFSRVCLSVFLYVQAITFEPLHMQISFLICKYIFTISRSSLSIKVIGSGSCKKHFSYFNMLIICMRLQVIDMVKITRQGHIKVKVKNLVFNFMPIYTVHEFTLKSLNGTD